MKGEEERGEEESGEKKREEKRRGEEMKVEEERGKEESELINRGKNNCFHLLSSLFSIFRSFEKRSSYPGGDRKCFFSLCLLSAIDIWTKGLKKSILDGTHVPRLFSPHL